MHALKVTMLSMLLALVLAPGGLQAAPSVPCPELLFPGGQCAPDVGAAVAACCPCDAPQFSNHGRYVSCVAHATNALRRADCLDAEARRSLKRCAARSTCGKPGFHTCCFTFPGVCGDDALCVGTDEAIPCTSELGCPERHRCTIKSDEGLCLAAGGVPGTGSCCSACGG
jgi:hypothetical protein